MGSGGTLDWGDGFRGHLGLGRLVQVPHWIGEVGSGGTLDWGDGSREEDSGAMLDWGGVFRGNAWCNS